MATEEQLGALLVECADVLQGWSELPNLGVTEVLAWWNEEPCIGLRGKASQIEKKAFNQQGIRNYGGRLEVSLQRRFGFDDVKAVMDRSGRLQYISGGLGQIISGDPADLVEVVDLIQRVVNATFEEELGVEVLSQIPIIPEEGEPWLGRPTPYYSAKKRKWFTGKEPKGVIEVETTDPETGQPITALGVDFCQYAIEVHPTGRRTYAARYYDGYDPTIMFSHCLTLGARGVTAEEQASYVNHCGGFLFLSLAVGPTPAVNFGPVCLLFDPIVVLEGLKPYRSGRGQWPVITYTTDVWTETMRAFVGRASAELYQQLTGQWTVGYYRERHMWVLGPPQEQYGGPGNEIDAEVIPDTKKLKTELRKRLQRWPRDMTAQQIEDQRYVNDQHRYPYLEAKSNAVIGVDALGAVVYPEELNAEVEAFLLAIGATARMIPLAGSYDAMDLASVYAWSWRIHDAVEDSMGVNWELIQLR